MYDVKLTTENFDGNVTVKRGFERVFTDQDAVIAVVSKNQLCDLNGKIIAKRIFVKKEDIDGKKIKTTVYRPIENASAEREILPTDFRLEDNKLYKDNELIGVIDKRKRNAVSIGFLFVTAALLILVLAFVLLIDIPYSYIPKIIVQDNDGYWGEGKIAVFDDKVYPEKQGEYEFIIENPHDAELKYSFRIAPVYKGEILDITDESSYFPFLFRLRMNNAHVETDEWLSVNELNYKDFEFLPSSSQAFTLEWKWPFESGNDRLDTLLGEEGSSISLILYLTAEVNEQ